MIAFCVSQNRIHTYNVLVTTEVVMLVQVTRKKTALVEETRNRQQLIFLAWVSSLQMILKVGEVTPLRQEQVVDVR